MFDLVLLFIEFSFAKKIVDGLVVLEEGSVLIIRMNVNKPTISKNWPSILYSQPFARSCSATLNTCSTARGIIPAVSES